MFYKIKVLSRVNLIITIITVLISSLLFSETPFAKEIEKYNDKPVFTRAIVEWEQNIKTLESLEENSDLIIKGVILDGKETLMINDSFGYTKTKVLVTNVINGDEDLLNQTIVCIEAFFETTRNGVSGYIMCDNYEPAIIGKEYILFLNNYTGDSELYNGSYFITYQEKGKYLINDGVQKAKTNTNKFVDGLSNEELNVGPQNANVYRDLYKSVLNKYVLNYDKEGNVPITESIISGESEGETTITKSAEELGALNKNDRLLIPLREVAELIGCNVEWDGNTKTAYVKKGENTVKFLISSNEYYVNEKIYELDTPAEIYDSKTYVPLRVVSEGLGVSIEYDINNKTVTLGY